MPQERSFRNCVTGGFKYCTILWEAFEYYPRLKRVLLHVSEHPDQALSLGDAASLAAMEKTHFSKYFHTKTGVPFKYWIDFLRIQRAQQQLRASERSVTEVAMDCGFMDTTTFTRTFRRIAGTTPAAFLRSTKPGLESLTLRPHNDSQ